jgi:hypothetical protein
LFSWPSPTRTVQVLADPVHGAADPYAIVERVFIFANTGGGFAPGPAVEVNGRPGFDLAHPAPLGLAILGETGRRLRGSSQSSACRLADGNEIRVVALHGDAVFRYSAAMDWLPLPQVADRDDALIEVFGPKGVALAATTSVHNASTEQWSALPHRSAIHI